MKLKKLILPIGVVLLSVFRVLQYVFGFIDKNGFFVRDEGGIFQTVLTDGLYWLMVIAALVVFILFFIKNKGETTPDALNVPILKWSYALSGLSLLVHGAVLLANQNWLGAVAVGAAVYFVLLFIWKGQSMPLVSFTAIFALGYPCAKVIQLFFDTFRESKASGNIFEVLSVCAMILLMLSLTKVIMGFEESVQTVARNFLLYALIGILPVIDLFYSQNVNLSMISETVSDFALWLMAVILYYVILRYRPVIRKGEFTQLIYAHRGASFDFPENTMLAFRKAYEQGADGIELDVHLTIDGQLVICHDDNIARTSDGEGSVEEMTYEQLLAFDFGAGEKIPLLSDVLEFIKESGMLLNIELKNRSGKENSLEKKVVDMVKEYELCDKVIYSSFDHTLLRRLKAYDAQARIGALYKTTPDNCLEYMKDLQVSAIHPSKKCADEQDMIALALEQGWDINVWTVDTVEQVQPLMQAQVSSFITNRPAFLREELSK